MTTNPRFFVDTDGYGQQVIFYGGGPDDLYGNPDVIATRADLDRQNLMLWRKVVGSLTAEWPDCDSPICHHPDGKQHGGNCRTNLVGGA
jgi:hypothetical protein